jgi:hypothetical protein
MKEESKRTIRTVRQTTLGWPRAAHLVDASGVPSPCRGWPARSPCPVGWHG